MKRMEEEDNETEEDKECVVTLTWRAVRGVLTKKVVTEQTVWSSGAKERRRR